MMRFRSKVALGWSVAAITAVALSACTYDDGSTAAPGPSPSGSAASTNPTVSATQTTSEPNTPASDISLSASPSDKSLGFLGPTEGRMLTAVPERTGGYDSGPLETKSPAILIRALCQGPGDLKVTLNSELHVVLPCRTNEPYGLSSALDTPAGPEFSVHVEAPSTVRWVLDVSEQPVSGSPAPPK
ncbi:hypothetical protein ACQQCD_08225 [Pseudarthrobacter sp. J1763]|uniref:hypothetical protein n=1 Tax=Pseudarthrobacter sp. J1763 TaxID=3420445 RepID=UPI003D2D9E9D